jgi:hypothetical protein
VAYCGSRDGRFDQQDGAKSPNSNVSTLFEFEKHKSKSTTAMLQLSWRDCQCIIYSVAATGKDSFLRLSAGCAITSESGRTAEGEEQSTSRGNL